MAVPKAASGYGATFLKLNSKLPTKRIAIPDLPPGRKAPVPQRPNINTNPNAPSPNPPPPQYPEYPAYNDVYSGLLSKLAQMRDLQLANLQADLERRQQNVIGIVNASRAPLNTAYNQATQEAAAVNDAVANRLNAQGTSAISDLKSQLAALGQDPTAATQNLSKYYSGTGNANYAMDAGDVQRLIGQQASANALLDQQPGIIGQQMQSDYATNQGNILNDFMQQSYDTANAGAQARSAYDQSKFQYQSDQADKIAQSESADETTYWNNYWQKQDLLFKRWQTQVASGDKKAANQTKAAIDAAQRQSAQDIAKIRAQASTDAANIRAGASVTGAQIRANATTNAAATRAAATKAGKAKTSGANSNINRQRAYQAALAAVIDPKTGKIHSSVNPTGYNADWTMTRLVNGVLKTYGINPNTQMGRSVIASVLSQASGKPFSNSAKYGLPAGSTYQYDPNWVKAAQKAAAKKRPKERKNH